MVQVKFKKLTDTAIVPKYKTAEAAGMDMYADEDVTILPRGHKTTEAAGDGFIQICETGVLLVKTGIAIELPEGYEAQVRPRSGLALRGISVLNSPGTVDSDYRGEVCVIIINHDTEPFEIKKGDRIAQMVVSPVTRAEMVEVQELSSSDRGSGGFGSTGSKG